MPLQKERKVIMKFKILFIILLITMYPAWAIAISDCPTTGIVSTTYSTNDTIFVQNKSGIFFDANYGWIKSNINNISNVYIYRMKDGRDIDRSPMVLHPGDYFNAGGPSFDAIRMATSDKYIEDPDINIKDIFTASTYENYMTFELTGCGKGVTYGYYSTHEVAPLGLYISNISIAGGTDSTISASFSTNITAECWFEVNNYPQYDGPHITTTSYDSSTSSIPDSTYDVRCVAMTSDTVVSSDWQSVEVTQPLSAPIISEVVITGGFDYKIRVSFSTDITSDCFFEVETNAQLSIPHSYGTTYNDSISAVPDGEYRVRCIAIANEFTTVGNWHNIILDSTPLSTEIIHVSVAGNDTTGNGTEGYPFASIPRAIDEICAYNNPSPGDTIYVHEGTYPTEPVAGNWDPYGRYGTYIWIMGAPGESKPRLTRAETAFITSFESAETPPHNFALKRLIFDKSSEGSHNVNMTSWNPLDIEPPMEQGYVHNVIIDSCEFYNRSSSSAGIKMAGVDSFVVSNCIFDGFDAGGIGLNVDGSHYGDVYNNTFNRQRMSGMLFKGGSHDIVIRNNFINDSSPFGIQIGGDMWWELCRPDTANMEKPNFEARNIDVYSNILIDCWIPFGFNCSRDSKVYNNQVIITDSLKTGGRDEPLVYTTCMGMVQFRKTSNWCELAPKDNKIYNNLFYYNHMRDYYVNIDYFDAPGTNSDEFASTINIWNNLWYSYDNPDDSWKSWDRDGFWNCVDTTGLNLYAQDPLLVEDTVTVADDIILVDLPTNDSLLTYQGVNMTPILGYDYRDFLGELFTSPPPIGSINITTTLGPAPAISNLVVTSGNDSTITVAFDTDITSECWFEVENHSEYVATHATGTTYNDSISPVTSDNYYGVRAVAKANGITARSDIDSIEVGTVAAPVISSFQATGGASRILASFDTDIISDCYFEVENNSSYNGPLVTTDAYSDSSLLVSDGTYRVRGVAQVADSITYSSYDTVEVASGPIISSINVAGSRDSMITVSFTTNVEAECWYEYNSYPDYEGTHDTTMAYSDSTLQLADGTYVIYCKAKANEFTTTSSQNFAEVIPAVIMSNITATGGTDSTITVSFDTDMEADCWFITSAHPEYNGDTILATTSYSDTITGVADGTYYIECWAWADDSTNSKTNYQTVEVTQP